MSTKTRTASGWYHSIATGKACQIHLKLKASKFPGYAALLAENEGALRLNTENTAHYITDYQGDLLDAVLADLVELDNTSKLQIVQERRLLAEAGHISYGDLLPSP